MLNIQGLLHNFIIYILYINYLQHFYYLFCFNIKLNKIINTDNNQILIIIRVFSIAVFYLFFLFNDEKIPSAEIDDNT
jgi:hypothetical protein